MFAPTATSSPDPLVGLADVAPELRKDLAVIATTEESPNDGVAVSMAAPAELVEMLEKTLLSMHESAEGALLLKDLFGAERFETAPRMGYRALYRVALATL